MKSNNATEALDERILMLESRKEYEMQLLKDHLHETFESLKPINIIKSTFRDLTASPEVKHNVVNSLIGLASGYLSRKIIIGSTHNPIKKVAGRILQFAVTKFVGNKINKD
jgi:hypothetical protein